MRVVAISNRRLVALDERGVSFRWKDYRAKGKTRYKTMTLSANEFMRRFLLHVLPSGFHRIRHYGLIANAGRRNNLTRARELLQVVGVEADRLPVVLLEDGRLTAYLYDLVSARKDGVDSTGNGRRESYAKVPIPRMRVTYLAAGEHEPEERDRTVNLMIDMSASGYFGSRGAAKRGTEARTPTRRPGWRGRCGPPARGTRWSAGTFAVAAPTARRWPTG